MRKMNYNYMVRYMSNLEPDQAHPHGLRVWDYLWDIHGGACFYRTTDRIEAARVGQEYAEKQHTSVQLMRMPEQVTDFTRYEMVERYN